MKSDITIQEPGWVITETSFHSENMETNGSKFLIGNGYMGLRGSLEEYGKEALAACTLSGLYDRSGDQWREPVNAPHAFNLKVRINGVSVSTDSSEIIAHNQTLLLANATHLRETTFRLQQDIEVTLKVERFMSLAHEHLGVMVCSLTTSKDCSIELETKTDRDVWDINGPHLENFQNIESEGRHCLTATTIEKGIPVAVASSIKSESPIRFEPHASTDSQLAIFEAKSGEHYQFTKYVAIYSKNDVQAPEKAAFDTLEIAESTSIESLKDSHDALWAQRWKNSDVHIKGDDEAQLALRYSIYHLLIAAPSHGGASIPARGLSGQVYKGAIFWDTEIFMLPFFNHTQPELARHLVEYRYRTLDGARRKAAAYGFRGAFYAWESQETGDDACTYFNITDVITGRPMRTYFRDKQIHISADVAHAIWKVYEQSGDLSILTEGGAEVILECARFFYSYASYKPDRNRYELHDVVGPDEYHERVHNNAFTNAMVLHTMRVALQVVDILQKKYPEYWSELEKILNIQDELSVYCDMADRLYMPAPEADTLIIEQFDGYHRLVDSRPADLKGKLLHPNEYWGGANGVATSTKVIKQADVVLMLHLFSGDYTEEVKRANWEYYEPRTEHGSSLSPCVYALLAAELGKTDWAYKYFLRTATIDLTGKSKQYVGDLYIGGTHPAANGGAWMATVLGFAGLRTHADRISIRPHIPEHWQELSFRFCHQQQWFSVTLSSRRISITADKENTVTIPVYIEGNAYTCSPSTTTCHPCNEDIKSISHKNDFLSSMQGAIFDLDGVIVDTAKYHFRAWKRLAEELGIEFTELDNERLKGVSRSRSLEILLSLGDVDVDDTTKTSFLEKKNEWYLEYILKMTQEEILPGAREYIEMLRSQGIRIALGSASKNAPLILDKLGITDLFDAVIDGNVVKEAKPAPDVFLQGAQALNLSPFQCVVFEDAEAGIEAAHRANMMAVGVGSPQALPQADTHIENLADLLSKHCLTV